MGGGVHLSCGEGRGGAPSGVSQELHPTSTGLLYIRACSKEQVVVGFLRSFTPNVGRLGVLNFRYFGGGGAVHLPCGEGRGDAQFTYLEGGCVYVCVCGGVSQELHPGPLYIRACSKEHVVVICLGDFTLYISGMLSHYSRI